MIVLASASPRRHRLLGETGLPFEIEVAGVDEDLEGNPTPSAAAEELALRKARAVAPKREPIDRVIGADTVVALDLGRGRWRLLGKPRDASEARRMLSDLSDTRHVVVTGVAVVAGGPVDRGEEVASESTWVTMRSIAPAEIEAYMASGEWRGKAGGYAIQENADAFVVSLEGGGFDNVVGLPVALTLALLGRFDARACEGPDGGL